MRADAVEVYELLKPKLGEEESRALLRFVEEWGEMPAADVIEVYELLKPKLGEEASKTLLRFIRERAEMAKGPVTKRELATLLSWIGPEPPGFTIMPASVRLSESRLLVALW